MSVILAERSPRALHPARTPAPILDHRRLRRTVGRELARVALFPGRPAPWPVGEPRRLGYPDADLAGLPRLAVESFCGLAYPFAAAAPHPGETVVDVGSGSGVDALIAAGRVGKDGTVIGVDLSEELTRKATRAARRAKRENVRFEKGLAEELPLADATADLALANGVVNLLVADKEGALREMWRVLRPGGRLVLADVAAERPVARAERSRPERWVDHLAGPVPPGELADLARAAGFTDVSWSEGPSPFDGTPTEPLARERGARGLVLLASKNR